jgi:MSHA pilin protein MshD
MYTSGATRHGCKPSRQAGFGLIELVIFIVVVSIGVTGVLSTMNLVTRNSVDPLTRKQAIVIAESLLDEIKFQPFTFCDPDDDGYLTTAASPADCPRKQEIVPTGTETRTAAPKFDNVGDYGGLVLDTFVDIYGHAIASPNKYSAEVFIAHAGLGFNEVADAVLRIDVRVRGPADTDLTLTGYRFRYAPNSVP